MHQKERLGRHVNVRRKLVIIEPSKVSDYKLAAGAAMSTGASAKLYGQNTKLSDLLLTRGVAGSSATRVLPPVLLVSL